MNLFIRDMIKCIDIPKHKPAQFTCRNKPGELQEAWLIMREQLAGAHCPNASHSQQELLNTGLKLHLVFWLVFLQRSWTAGAEESMHGFRNSESRNTS